MAKWNQRSEADRYNARVSNVFTSRGNLTDLAGYFFSGYGPVSFMVGGGSAAERYAAVLTDSCLQTFDRKLAVFDRSWDVLAATQVIARPDGTVLLVGSGGTRLFIP